jgi:hypothetical protein
MKLDRRTELIVSGVLIAYLAFTPGFQIIKDILATGLGRAAFLAMVVYVFKFVSASVALLLLVGYIRCIKMKVWEGADDSTIQTDASTPTFTCDEGFTYATDVGKCRNEKGELKDAIVTCETGWAYDDMTKKCKQNSVMTEPIVTPPPMAPPIVTPTPVTPPTVAPAVSTAPVTSPTMPMTTPSMTPPPSVPAAGTTTGPMPTETFIPRSSTFSPF